MFDECEDIYINGYDKKIKFKDSLEYWKDKFQRVVKFIHDKMHGIFGDKDDKYKEMADNIYFDLKIVYNLVCREVYMYIFLGIVGELATVVGSVAISLNGAFDSVLEISKNGYKIDKSVLDEYEKRQAEEKKEKTNGFKKALGVVLLFVPGVNLLRAGIANIKMKKSVMNDPQIKEALIPMTDSEKEQYAKMEGKMQKLAFTAFTTAKENEQEEFFGFIGKRPIVVDHGLTSLSYEELIPLAYTLDEVKRLNEATTYSYRIGKIDGKNVAVIGIPNPDSPVSRIQFKSEDYKITHAYDKMTEEEAQDKTFIVYPFTTHNEEEVQKVIEEIKQFRIDGTRANLELVPKQTIFEPAYVPTETKETIVEEQGPVLKKTLYPKGK